MKFLEHIKIKNSCLQLEKMIIGVEEPIFIKGVGEILAKADSGNGAFNVIHGEDFYRQGSVIVFTTFDEEGKEHRVSKKIQDTITINVGAGHQEERPIVLFDIKFANEEFLNVPFSVGNRSNNKNKVLLGKEFLVKELDALIDISKDNISDKNINVDIQISEAKNKFKTPKNAGKGIKGRKNKSMPTQSTPQQKNEIVSTRQQIKNNLALNQQKKSQNTNNPKLGYNNVDNKSNNIRFINPKNNQNDEVIDIDTSIPTSTTYSSNNSDISSNSTNSNGNSNSTNSNNSIPTSTTYSFNNNNNINNKENSNSTNSNEKSFFQKMSGGIDKAKNIGKILLEPTDAFTMANKLSSEIPTIDKLKTKDKYMIFKKLNEFFLTNNILAKKITNNPKIIKLLDYSGGVFNKTSIFTRFKTYNKATMNMLKALQPMLYVVSFNNSNVSNIKELLKSINNDLFNRFYKILANELNVNNVKSGLQILHELMVENSPDEGFAFVLVFNNPPNSKERKVDIFDIYIPS